MAARAVVGTWPCRTIVAHFLSLKGGGGVVPKKPENSRKTWMSHDVAELKKELKQNTPTRVIGLHLERSASAVQQKTNELGLSTKPVNRPPRSPKRK
jgi:hypothetical protein